MFEYYKAQCVCEHDDVQHERIGNSGDFQCNECDCLLVW